MAGITNEGLTIKRLNEVLDDLRGEAVPIFQDLVPPEDTVDTSDSSAIGRLIGLVSPSLADLWEAIQEVYQAFDPNTARGIPLDNLVMYAGITRNPPVPTRADIVVWGNENVLIPRGITTVRSTDNQFYTVDNDIWLVRSDCIGAIVRLDSVTAGNTYMVRVTQGYNIAEATVEATESDTPQSVLSKLYTQLGIYSSILCTQLGANQLTVESSNINDSLAFSITGVLIHKIKGKASAVNQNVVAIRQEANTITHIANPILGWDSVTNPFPAITGRDRETDEELRRRFRESKFIRASNIADSLYSALFSLEGVESVAVYENVTNTHDSEYDLPPHSFKAIVLGGDSREIADAIWKNKPLGIASQGNTTEEVVDSQGHRHDITFGRPDLVDIEIDITLSVTENFPSGGLDQIKEALITYGTNNISVGGDVIYSRLYTPINSVSGHQVDQLRIRRSGGSWSTSNIPIEFDEMAIFSANNISISVA